MPQSAPQLLVISAHADDHIMMAGSLFKLQQRGYAINEILLTDSGQGPDQRHSSSVTDIADLRQQEFLAACGMLGTHQIFEFSQPDLHLQPEPNLIWDIVGIIRQLQPEYVFLHHWHDWHPDHLAAHNLGRQAVKMAASGIQPHRGQAWATPYVLATEGALSIKPDILIDITDFADRKLGLWQAYASQATSDETEFIDSLMKVRGYQLRQGPHRRAEAFNVVADNPLQLI